MYAATNRNGLQNDILIVRLSSNEPKKSHSLNIFKLLIYLA